MKTLKMLGYAFTIYVVIGTIIYLNQDKLQCKPTAKK